MSISIYHNQYYIEHISFTDLSPIPVRSAVKSYLTSWFAQNLSKRVLNRLTVLTVLTCHQQHGYVNYSRQQQYVQKNSAFVGDNEICGYRKKFNILWL